MAVIRPWPGMQSGGGGLPSGQTNDPFLFDGSFDAAWTGGVNLRSHSAALNYQLSAQTISAEISESTWSTGTLTVDTNITNQRTWQFTAPVLSIANGVTVTRAATLYIDAAPSNTGGGTLSDAYAVWVDAGSIRSDGQILGAGSISAPAYSFFGDANTGIYQSADANIDFSINGTRYFGINTSSAEFIVAGYFPSGSASAPGLAGRSFSTTGWYWAAGPTLGTTVNGVSVGTVTGAGWVLTQDVNTSGSPTLATFTGAAHTTLTASTEAIDVLFNIDRTVQFAQGAITSQRAIVVEAPTWAFATSSSTVTNATLLALGAAPTAGTNAVFTNTRVVSAGAAVTIGATSAGMTYTVYDVPAHTVTVTGSTQVTSASMAAGVRIGAITLTDSSAVTIDTAASLYIAGPPVAAGSVTLSTPLALFIDSGNARFDGVILNSDGSAAAPSYSFASSGSSDNGMYLSAANTVGFAAAGVASLHISNPGTSLLAVGPTTGTLVSNAYTQLELIGDTVGSIIVMNEPGGEIISLICDANGFTTAPQAGAFRFKWKASGNITGPNDWDMALLTTGALVLGVTGDTQHSFTVAAGTSVVFNETQIDIDFRIESDNNANAFVIDAGTDTLALGGAVAANVRMNINFPAASSGSMNTVTVVGAAHTAQATTVEVTDINANLARTITWTDGAITTQRAIRMQFPTWDTGGDITTGTFLSLEVPTTWITGSGSTITAANVVSVTGSPNIGATAAGTTYSIYNVAASTVTVTGTTQITSACAFAVHRVGILTITDASAVTIDAAASIYVAGPPAQAGSVTLTATYSLWLDTGIARFDGSVLIGGTAIETGSTNTLNIFNGTAPDAGVADTVIMYSSDISAGNTMPSFYCEGTGVIATGQADSASSVRVKMRINGTEVTILCI